MMIRGDASCIAVAGRVKMVPSLVVLDRREGGGDVKTRARRTKSAVLDDTNGELTAAVRVGS